MSERSAYTEGTPNWVDLMTPDREASKSFYEALFGWTYLEEPTDQGPTYTMCQQRDHPVAGMGPLPPDMAAQGVPPMWNSYVAVDDLDATLAKVEPAAGSVMMPAMDVMEAGRMAGIADPTGAALMVWQAGEHIGATLVNEPGAPCWNELISPDVEAAAAFYRQVLGWESEAMAMPDMTYTLFKVGGSQIAGGMAPPMEGMPPHWLVYFAVDDVDAAVTTASANGGQALAEPMDTPAGRLVPLVDPQGAMCSVIAPTDPAA
jgi:hypothetical protein